MIFFPLQGVNAEFKFVLENCTSNNTKMDAFDIDQLGNIRVKNSAILDREKTKSIQCQVGSALQNVNMVHLHQVTYLMFIQKIISTKTLKGTLSQFFFFKFNLPRLIQVAEFKIRSFKTNEEVATLETAELLNNTELADRKIYGKQRFYFYIKQMLTEHGLSFVNVTKKCEHCISLLT